LNDLLPGDWVELRAYFFNDQYRLLRLERNDPDDVTVYAPLSLTDT